MYVCAYAVFFKRKPLVLHHVLKGINDSEDVRNHWMIMQSKPVHIAWNSHSSPVYLGTHFIADSSNQKGVLKMICCQRPPRFMCWTIRVLWLSLKKLPTDNVITFLSYRAEPLYDPKHIFFKKRWAYLSLAFTHTHYRVGKSFSQGKNTSLSFPIASLFWQERPLTLTNKAEYLPC